MADTNSNDTFAEIAVGLSSALSSLRLHYEHSEHVARKIGLPHTSIILGLAPLKRDIDLVEQARDIFKSLCEFEPEMRALLESWAPREVKQRAAVKLLAGAAR